MLVTPASVEALALDSLPSMPATAVTIVGLCDDPNVGMDELAQAVALDPGLAARILRMANSAAYSRGNEITSLDRAMMQMGLKVVKLTALGFVVSSTLSDELSSNADLAARVWRQCLVEAVACRELASLAGVRASAEAFLSGLFDGMGPLLGLVVSPETYPSLIAENPWPGPEAERDSLGMTLGELVGAALTSWGVPELYARVLEAGDAAIDPNDTSEVGRLGAVLVLGRQATRLLLGDAGWDPARASAASAALGLTAEAVDTIAINLTTHVAELASTLDVDLGTEVDHQELLNQARTQMVETSMEIAQESVMKSEQISTLETQTDELRRDASTDRLTGLPNRASFDDALARAVDDRIQGRTVSGALGIAMVDIDHFKQLNDTYGHRTGDAVLAAVGQTLQRITRKGEMIARYGGEEFVLVAPIVDDIDTLANAAERIRREIAALHIDCDGLVLTVTVSVGAAAAAHMTAPGAAGALTEAADRLLYQAKHAGRNTTRVDSLGFNLPPVPEDGLPPAEHG